MASNQEKRSSMELSSTAISTTDEQSNSSSLLTNELEILSRQTDTQEIKIGFFKLYQYATTLDKAILIFSAFCAVTAGVALPVMTVS
jgi:ATP-binding cassette subfamily B (MDR/TAP) protein 1